MESFKHLLEQYLNLWYLNWNQALKESDNCRLLVVGIEPTSSYELLALNQLKPIFVI